MGTPVAINTVSNFTSESSKRLTSVDDLTSLKASKDMTGSGASFADILKAKEEAIAQNPHESGAGETVGSIFNKVEDINTRTQNDLIKAISPQGQSLSESDLMRAQFKMYDTVMVQTMIGKVGEKGGQGVNQLLRGQ